MNFALERREYVPDFEHAPVVLVVTHIALRDVRDAGAASFRPAHRDHLRV